MPSSAPPRAAATDRPTDELSRRTLRYAWRRSLTLSLVLYIVLQTLWIASTPIKYQAMAGSLPESSPATVLVGTGPDEPEHYLYVLSVAVHGSLPVPLPQFRRSPGEFVSHEAQHPPLFYLLAAALRNIVHPLGDKAVWYTLRGFSALCGALIIWLISRAALVAFPDRPLIPLATPPLLAMLPIFGYMMGTLSNVPLEMVFTAWAWLMLVEMVRGRRALTIRSGLVLGLALGLAAVTRVTSLLWLPTVLLLLIFVYRRSPAVAKRETLRSIAAALIVLAVFAAPWFVHMKLAYGQFLFRSDYRPMLGYISLMQYLADPHQLITAPNYPEHVRMPPLTIALWFTSSSWAPFWLMQSAIWTLSQNSAAPGVVQSIFILVDTLVLTALLLHWARSRGSVATENDTVERVLVWCAAISVIVSVLMVLQQQFYVDLIIFAYAGRYTCSVIAASALLFLFALSSRSKNTVRGGIIGAAVIGALTLLFNLWSLSLLHQFYTSAT